MNFHKLLLAAIAAAMLLLAGCFNVGVRRSSGKDAAGNTFTEVNFFGHTLGNGPTLNAQAQSASVAVAPPLAVAPYHGPLYSAPVVYYRGGYYGQRYIVVRPQRYVIVPRPQAPQYRPQQQAPQPPRH
jgi:hypothetical protein